MDNLERIFNQLIRNADLMCEIIEANQPLEEKKKWFEFTNENKNLWSEALRFGIAEELGEKISKHYIDLVIRENT